MYSFSVRCFIKRDATTEEKTFASVFMNLLSSHLLLTDHEVFPCSLDNFYFCTVDKAHQQALELTWLLLFCTNSGLVVENFSRSFTVRFL